MATKIPEFEVDNVIYEFYDVDAVHTNQLADFLSQENIRTVIGNLFFPVGSIYMTASDTDPSVIFGGTWEAVEGRVIMGSDANHPLGSIGGREDAIVPRHNHEISIKTGYVEGHQHALGGSDSEFTAVRGGMTNIALRPVSGGNYRVPATPSGSFHRLEKTAYAGTHRHDINGWTDSEGEIVTGANNMPYVAYHIWRRTA